MPSVSGKNPLDNQQKIYQAPIEAKEKKNLQSPLQTLISRIGHSVDSLVHLPARLFRKLKIQFNHLTERIFGVQVKTLPQIGKQKETSKVKKPAEVEKFTFGGAEKFKKEDESFAPRNVEHAETVYKGKEPADDDVIHFEPRNSAKKDSYFKEIEEEEESGFSPKNTENNTVDPFAKEDEEEFSGFQPRGVVDANKQDLLAYKAPKRINHTKKGSISFTEPKQIGHKE